MAFGRARDHSKTISVCLTIFEYCNNLHFPNEPVGSLVLSLFSIPLDSIQTLAQPNWLSQRCDAQEESEEESEGFESVSNISRAYSAGREEDSNFDNFNHENFKNNRTCAYLEADLETRRQTRRLTF